MHNHQILTATLFALPAGVTAWLRHLGGLGLIFLGLLDNSVVPVPGSMDALTIVLASDQRQWWPYYAFMATVGSVIGGYVTYQFARKGGEETLIRRLSKERAAQVRKTFSQWGVFAIAIPAVLPPPVPMVPFILAAGATQYSRYKFLSALVVGRAVRYTLLALLGGFYGGRIVTMIAGHGRFIVYVAVAATLIAAFYFLFLRKRKPTHEHA